MYQNPFQILLPEERLAPSLDQFETQAYEMLLPPLVYNVRKALYEWGIMIIKEHHKLLYHYLLT